MQAFTAAEVTVLDKLENVAIGVRAFSSSREGLSPDQCAKLVQLLADVPPVPTPSLPIQDGRAVATLAMFEAVLAHIRQEVTEGSLGGGLHRSRARIVNRLADMIHNLPKIVAGSHWRSISMSVGSSTECRHSTDTPGPSWRPPTVAP